ncbi:sigma-E processing peptidase SpoIIGA [Thalassorhabdus alkalitolerans]|uniref:Sporulation sigma-E factor-processing peptidase n=1 Tax=Thalassorhabdus alkalitolerans TaxID=2282697 RepID=A0ABW0YQ56_9BACI
MILYLDLIWIGNFVINIILLLLTARFLKRKISLKRLLIVAAVSSSTVFLILTPLEGFFLHPLGKFLLSVGVVIGTFGFYNFSFLFQGLFMFYMVSFVAGGGVLAFHNFFHTSPVLKTWAEQASFASYASLHWLTIILSLPLIWLITVKAIQYHRTRGKQEAKCVDVEIKIDSLVIEGRGLVDTGNQLKDPITKTPVMIVQTDLFKERMSESQFEKFSRLLSLTENMNEETISVFWQERIRIIPFRAVGKQQDWLIALKPDEVKINIGEKEHILPRIFIGLEEGALSATSDFQMIVPSEQVEEFSGESAS